MAPKDVLTGDKHTTRHFGIVLVPHIVRPTAPADAGHMCLPRARLTGPTKDRNRRLGTRIGLYTTCNTP